MPTATFRMVGTLSLPKESEKFKPYEEKIFDTGWVRRSLKLNVTCGTSRHIVSVDGGYMKNNPDYKMYTCFRNNDGFENVSVLFSERNDPTILDQVASFSKFVFDTYTGKRWELEGIIEGRIALSEEMKNKYSISTIEEAREVLEKSKKKKKEYISGYDLAGVLNRFVTDEKFKSFSDKKFLVTGEIEYREYNGKIYEDYKAKRFICLGKAEDESKAMVHFFFGQDACDGEAVNGFYQVKGYTPCYDKDIKGDRFYPYVLNIPKSTDEEKGERINSIRLKRFEVEDESIREVGISVNLVNGSLARQIQLEDLSEDEQDAILCGDTTLEDIRQEHGSVVGERVKMNVFDGWLRGYISGSQPTTYTEEDMEYHPAGDEDDMLDDLDEDIEEDVDEDLEDDDDDELF